MTGFGKAEVPFRNKVITVEIRSVNSKQLDLNTRIPACYRQAESAVRSLVARELGRGKVDLFIAAERQQSSRAAGRIDLDAFEAYRTQLHELYASGRAAITGNAAADAVLIQTILRMPDVVPPAETAAAADEEEQRVLLDAVQEACRRLDAFRTQEGAVLIADLERRVELIERYMAEVTPFEEARTEHIRARIAENLSRLPVEVDPNRLAQEMIFYIEKLDITEEKVRLANHCRYFREVAAGEEAAGRKLGFIAQEMGREINTMGSKANESEIQQRVVQMKDELEKIKEQVLNIL